MSRSGIVNVRMVITEEKILSNIDKVQKLINPNSKKQIVELEEDGYFKDLVESIKSYLTEYPKKNNFPTNVYKATYGLVEFATTQFEENTKKIEELIKKREENIALSGILKETIEVADEKQENWQDKVDDLSDKFGEDVIDALNVIGNAKTKKSRAYTDAIKFVNARVNNLEANLHIEIDMERLEDSSKALSYIGIEIADALKLIPVPEEQLAAVAIENAREEERTATTVTNTETESTPTETLTNVTTGMPTIEENGSTLEQLVDEKLAETQNVSSTEQQQYTKETTFEAKPSLWQKFKRSKFVRAATYIFRIKIRIELPSNALPEGRGE